MPNYVDFSSAEGLSSTSLPTGRVCASICSCLKCRRTRSRTATPTATRAAVHSTRSTNKTLITTGCQNNRWRRQIGAQTRSSMTEVGAAKRIQTDRKALTASPRTFPPSRLRFLQGCGAARRSGLPVSHSARPTKYPRCARQAFLPGYKFQVRS
jgi:hypothetical protein